MNDLAEFTVTLHHLAPDGRQGGAEFPDVDLPHVTPKKLRALLEALAAIAPKLQFPSEPELRITGPHGRFLVQGKGGQVRVISWSTSQGLGAHLSPERILAMIMGMEGAEGARISVATLSGESPRRRRWKIALLALAIIGSNAVTAWFVTRRPAAVPIELIPAYRLVPPPRAERILSEFAGSFETAAPGGARRLTISPAGKIHWEKLQANRTLEESFELTAQAAEANGKPALAVSNQGVVEMTDPLTLVYFGDAYHRTKG